MVGLRETRLTAHEAHLNYQMLASYPVEVFSCESMSPQEVLDALGNPDLIIDALLGIGGQGGPRFPMDMAIRWATSQIAQVVACDIPSGVSADTGYAYDPCIQADLTITMGFAKIGLLSYPGRMYAGHLIVENLAFPPDLVARYCAEDGDSSQGGLVGEAMEGQRNGPIKILAKATLSKQVFAALKTRNHHKGMSGHVLVIAGSVGMAGLRCYLPRALSGQEQGLLPCFVPVKLTVCVHQWYLR